MKKFQSKLRVIRTAKGLTLEEVGDYVGVSKTTVQRWESGNIQNMRRDRISKLAHILGITPDEIVGVKRTPEFVTFAEVGCVRAGYNGIAVEEYTGRKVMVSSDLLNGDDPKDFFVLRVKGQSMYPQILDGDQILCERVSSVDSGTIAVVLNEDEATVKRVRYTQGEDWLDLVPVNPEYETKHITGADLEKCRVIGRVVNLMRSFR